MVSGLDALFDPERVAVVGATEREGSVGRAVTRNMVDSFTGETVPVNPNAETVFGRRARPDLASVPGTVDLAVVVVPPEAAVEVVREAGEAGIERVVVITAGFGEAGSEGARRERALRAVAEEYDLQLVGPNSLGVLSTGSGLNATFGPDMALPGDVSFMSQSGAFITAVLDWANDRGLGFRDVVSLGNKAVLDERDFIEAWGADPDTSVVLGYLEGVTDGRAFIDTVREVTDETPVVVVKSGRTEAGAHAAASHTGAIAGSESAYEVGLKQAGVVRAETVEELFDAAEALDGQPLPEGDSVAVVTNAGGPGVMATDAVGDSDLSLASFADETLDRFREALPEEANVYNPVDVIGDAPVERFGAALEIALADPNVDSVAVIACPVAVLTFEELAREIVEKQAAAGKPVAACFMGGDSVREATPVLNEAGVPAYFDPARAVRSLDVLREYAAVRTREYEAPTTFDVDREAAREVLRKAAARAETRLGVEAMGLFDAYGIPTPAGEVTTSPHEALEAAESIAGDVVMKIVSPDILHKSDIGGVRVGVPNRAVYDAYEDLVTRVRNYQPDATLLGVLVQEELDLSAGVETIVGATRDPQFGPLVLFGLGGIFVEVLEDTTVRVAPVSEREAAEMLDDIRATPLLRGARGRAPVDEAAVVETLQRLSQLVTDFPAILELDVNPLVVTPDGVRAVDVRLTVDPEEL